MYRHILVPTDGSKLSLKAARAAAALAATVGAKITGLYVIEPFEPQWTGALRALAPTPVSPREYQSYARKRAAAALETAGAHAAAAGVKFASLVVEHRNPWQAIGKAAQSKKCDLIAMSSHGRRGLEGLLLGSQTSKVLTHSKVPVLVYR